ncbi:hypothetical protein [Methanoculleus sp.]|uniref:hypothetical protein n=1 Tax=Methanoculleus sp. TaxID=90427 RepID=UPI00260B0555|nr:hypothetical protein [Methanoculleus sp.]MDI6866510.1 hypothetical protein [Methanoculleus sp.]
MRKGKKRSAPSCSVCGLTIPNIERSDLIRNLFLLGCVSIFTKLMVLFLTTSVFHSFVDLFDISVYFGYAMNVLNGQMPYIDFSVEYPFMFLIPVLIPLIPAMIANDANVYVAGFQVLMAFFDILTLFLVYLIGLRIFDSKRAFRAALLYATAFAASYFILTKYDSFPTFLLVLGTFAAVYGMPARSYISTILGFFTKVFPAIAIPYLVPFNASRTSLKTEITTVLKVVAVCGAIFLIPMILLVQDWYRPFLFATGTGVGVYANTVTYTLYNLINVVLHIPISEGVISLVMYILMIGIILLLILVSWVKGVENPRRLLVLIAVTLFMVIFCTKFHSPQYLVWLTPFYALLLIDSLRNILMFYLLQAVVYIEFPIAWGVLYVNRGYVNEIGTVGWYGSLAFFIVHAAVYLASILLILKSDPTLYDDTRSAVRQVISRIRGITR